MTLELKAAFAGATAFTALETWIATGTKPSPTTFPSAEGLCRTIVPRNGRDKRIPHHAIN